MSLVKLLLDDIAIIEGKIFAPFQVLNSDQITINLITLFQAQFLLLFYKFFSEPRNFN
jgi:hypothetical protein